MGSQGYVVDSTDPAFNQRFHRDKNEVYLARPVPVDASTRRYKSKSLLSAKSA
jgi:hypothetical protein